MPKNKGKRGEARSLSDLGLVYYHTDKLVEARSVLEKAVRQMKKHNDKKGEANCNSTLGDIYLELGDLENAESHYKQAIKNFRASASILTRPPC